jgi:hypothetical protein
MIFNQKYDQTKYDQVKFNMMKNIKDLIKRYGADSEKVIHGRALKTALKSKDMNENRLKELIYQSISETKPDVLDLDKEGNKTEPMKKAAKDAKSKVDEDLDLGHTDNEPNMLKADLYKIGKYAMELYKMMDNLENTGQEIDFPHWWQAKIIRAASMVSSAKHYLEFELKEPQVNAMVDVASDEDVIDEKLTSKTPMKKYIKDFSKSDAPQFKGKSKEKKRQMAVAAKLSAENPTEGLSEIILNKLKGR